MTASSSSGEWPDTPGRVALNLVLGLFVLAAGLAATGAIAAIVDTDGWRAGVFATTEGLWLLPASAAVGASVAGVYARFLRSEVVGPSGSERLRLGGHPLGNVTWAIPVFAPLFVLIVGRGRVLEGLAAVALLTGVHVTTLEYFRRRFLPRPQHVEAQTDRAEDVQLYRAGAITAGCVTVFALASELIYSGALEADTIGFTLAIGLSLTTAAAYVGFFGNWVSSVPVIDLPMRILVLAAWALLAVPAFSGPDGWRPLLTTGLGCVLFIAIAEPIRRKVVREWRMTPTETVR